MTPSHSVSIVAAAAVVVVVSAAVAGAIAMSCSREEVHVISDPAPPAVVLLTGFEPFGERTVNDSWEAIRVLDGTTIAGREISTVRLPVVYDAMAEPLRTAIQQKGPEVVISFGEGTEVVRVETLGRNGYHEKRPLDNAKKPPPRDVIEPDGPATAPNALPTERILAAWKAAGISSRASDDAGGYLCNECLWRLMRTDGNGTSRLKRRGFIHVPVTGTKSPSGEVFDLATLRRAARIAVEETLKDIDAEAPKPAAK